MEDREILDLYWQRDEQAIHQTEQRYGERLQGISYRIVGNLPDAQECVNDTYLQAWNTIPPQRPNYFFSFLAKICRYISLGRLDWNNAAKRKADVVSLTDEMELCIPDECRSREMDAKALGQMLTRFLKAQRESARNVFLRRYFYMDSISEIAARYGYSESKVKSMLYRTRSKLYEYLKSEGMEI
ncbi:MAG: RNA polymerase sigma factor [Faecousia sp.]